MEKLSIYFIMIIGLLLSLYFYYQKKNQYVFVHLMLIITSFVINLIFDKSLSFYIYGLSIIYLFVYSVWFLENKKNRFFLLLVMFLTLILFYIQIQNIYINAFLKLIFVLISVVVFLFMLKSYKNNSNEISVLSYHVFFLVLSVIY